MSKKRGLPDGVAMRHDAHYVEVLAHRFEHHVGKYVPTEMLTPNPNQPRKDMGDLSELKASIVSKGILEPLLVRAIGDGTQYEIICGERRYQAALLVGLDEVPIIEIPATDSEVIELALIENLQRRDLDPFEEADGYAFLMERYRYKQEKIAEVTGKARPSVAEAIRLARIPLHLRERCRRSGILAKSILIEIARLETTEEMERLLDAVEAGELDREALRAARHKASRGSVDRARPFVFRCAPKGSGFHLRIAFRRSNVEREEVIAVLEGMLERLRGAGGDQLIKNGREDGSPRQDAG